MRALLIFAGLLLAISNVVGQATKTDSAFATKIELARHFVDSLKKSQNIPAVAVAVGVRGKTVWSEAFGLANAKDQVSATVNTKFRVGSISKTMTAFALAKLYDQGKLDFDDEAGKYLPEFANKKYPVTIRQLAGHQGGVRHYKGFEFMSDKQYNSVEEAMTIFADDKLLFEPGTQYSYSTYGYVALSRIIEKVSGMSYLEYMQKEVFEPLGMKNTVAENAGADESNKATCYSKGGKRESGSVNLSSKWAGGGFLSTPEDLVSMVNRASKIMSSQTAASLMKPQSLKNGEMTDYGMGCRYTEVQSNGRILIHHGGTSVGARAFLMILLNEQIVVAICTNADADYNAQEVYNIAKFFLP